MLNHIPHSCVHVDLINKQIGLLLLVLALGGVEVPPNLSNRVDVVVKFNCRSNSHDLVY